MTDFGKVVKITLTNRDKTFSWLVEQVKEKTGLYVDSPYMSKIMSGARKNAKIVAAIKEILSL